jgi:hypothetical protein
LLDIELDGFQFLAIRQVEGLGVGAQHVLYDVLHAVSPEDGKCLDSLPEGIDFLALGFSLLSVPRVFPNRVSGVPDPPMCAVW